MIGVSGNTQQHRLVFVETKQNHIYSKMIDVITNYHDAITYLTNLQNVAKFKLTLSFLLQSSKTPLWEIKTKDVLVSD